MNEKILIKKCLNGDQQAFDRLIRMYYEYVIGFLLKATSNKTLAEDLTQETFLKMIQNIEKFNLKGTAGFGTWLIAIAKNCYIDYLRKNRIHHENIENIYVEDECNLEDDFERKSEYEQVMSVMKTLPPEQALAIKLKYVEDMTLAQIAEQFGTQSKTVKSRIHDGKVTLRKKLNNRERKDGL